MYFTTNLWYCKEKYEGGFPVIQYFQDLAQQFTHPVTAIAQCIGFVQVILGFFVFRNVSRRTSITIKAVCDFLAATHFALLGQWTGCAVCSVNIARGVCFSQKGRKIWASGVYMPILFCALTVVTSLFSWTGLESLLPMIGSCLAVIGYWCKDTAKLRLFNLAGISLWLIYGIVTLSMSTIVGNVVYITSILITMIRVRGEAND